MDRHRSTRRRRRFPYVLAALIALLAVAWATLPSDARHLRELRADLREHAKELGRDYLSQEDTQTAFLGNLLLDSGLIGNSLIDAAIETRFDLSVRNYAVVSFGIVRDRQSGREAVASIALFGTVVPLTDAILKIAAPRQPADTLASPADTLASPAATTP